MPSRSLRQLRAIASDLEIRKIDELGKSQLKNMINKLVNEGISHRDLHAGNVYVVISPGELPRFLIIDFC